MLSLSLFPLSLPPFHIKCFLRTRPRDANFVLAEQRRQRREHTRGEEEKTDKHTRRFFIGTSKPFTAPACSQLARRAAVSYKLARFTLVNTAGNNHVYQVFTMEERERGFLVLRVYRAHVNFSRLCIYSFSPQRLPAKDCFQIRAWSVRYFEHLYGSVVPPPREFSVLYSLLKISPR